MADNHDIELVLVTGAGASVSFGAGGTTIPAMTEWCNALCAALNARDPGIGLLVKLSYQMSVA